VKEAKLLILMAILRMRQKLTLTPTQKQAQHLPKEQAGSKTYPSWYKFRQ